MTSPSISEADCNSFGRVIGTASHHAQQIGTRSSLLKEGAVCGDCPKRQRN